MYAEVILTRPTHLRPPAGSDPLRDSVSRLQTFTYRLPDRLRDTVTVGHLVQVPLGAGTALGVVASVAPEPPPQAPPVLREVSELLDPLPVVTPAQVDLARWISEEYVAPLSEAIRLMLPPGLEERTSIVVSQQASESTEALTQQEAAALRLLSTRRGALPLRTLLGRLRSEDAEALVHGLVEKGLAQAKYALVPPRVLPRVRYVALLADERSIRFALPHLGRSSTQADLLLAIARRADTPVTLTQLCEWVGCTPAPVYALAQRGWVAITSPRTLIVATSGTGSTTGARLARAPKQAAALAALNARGGAAELGTFVASAGISPTIVRDLERRDLVRRIAEPALVLPALPQDQLLEKVVELRGATRDRAVLEALRGTTDRVWVGGIYAQTGADLATLRRLAARGLVSLHAELRDYSSAIPAPEMPPLTQDQEEVWREVSLGLASSQDGGRPFSALLHGVVGSGKTEICLHAIEQALASGRRVVLLTGDLRPVEDISRRLTQRFPGRVAVQHGRLSPGQRYETWDRVRRGEVDVLVGPRSALFAPIPRLGLVVIHNAHDESYKLQEPISQPPYHACDVAAEIGRLTGATVLYISATPDVVMYSRAAQGTLRLLELPHRLAAVTREGAMTTPPALDGQKGRDSGSARYETPPSDLPPIEVVDLRQELRAGNRSIFSRTLQQALSDTLSVGKQAILFVNRRGAATFVLCRDCGYVVCCPRCDIPLTFHGVGRTGAGTGRRVQSGRTDGGGAQGFEGLICHRCNYRQPTPSSCPRCGRRQIRYFGLGTERVETELRELFSEVRILRWDRDAAAGPDREPLLPAFTDHEVDVLVGTEMIANGLDSPAAPLVGIISADTALNLPDYRAAERTFQLLTQVVGLAGAGQGGGKAIIQTYHPDHYAIRAVASRDYAAFYRHEVAFRRVAGYPPHRRLLALRFQDVEFSVCQAEAQRLGSWLQAEIRRLDLPADLIGPAPCFFTRVLGRYRWQIVIRAPDPAALLRHVALPRGWRIDVDPVTLL